MAAFALIHGGGDVGWYWHLVERELRQRGHESVAPDLPCDDDSAGLPEYADTMVEAIGDRGDVVVVAQSFGGFTAPLVADRIAVHALVLVAGMIPAPGERPDDWVANTGFDQVMREHEQGDLYYHDVPRALAGQARARPAPSQPPPGTAHGRWPRGRTCRPSSCCAPRTASSRPSSCTASSPTAAASPPTRSPPVIARRSAVRRNWPTCSPDTPLDKPV